MSYEAVEGRWSEIGWKVVTPDVEGQSSKHTGELRWRVNVWATCVFRVFLGSSGQLGVVLWIHLVFLLDETAHKQMQNSPSCSNYSLHQLEQICISVTAELTACCIMTLRQWSTALIKTERNTKKVYYPYGPDGSRLFNK